MNCVKHASDRIVMLINGTCYADGTYQQLIALNDPEVKQFFE
jgi:phospholipid/cholesterol/gamma-HCH transport system ATP-binding protein